MYHFDGRDAQDSNSYDFDDIRGLDFSLFDGAKDFSGSPTERSSSSGPLVAPMSPLQLESKAWSVADAQAIINDSKDPRSKLNIMNSIRCSPSYVYTRQVPS